MPVRCAYLILYICVFLFGIVMGSFLNVCIYRYPKNESLLKGSHFLANGFNVMSVIYCLLTSALIVLSIIDFRQYIIPDKVNIVILVLGIIATIVDQSQWKDHVIGFFSVSVILLIIYLVTVGRGIGGGDVKLMAVAGLVIGWKACIVAFIVGCIAGSIIHVIRMKVSGANHRLALGPYLSMGIWFAMLFSEPIIEWYLRLCGLA